MALPQASVGVCVGVTPKSARYVSELKTQLAEVSFLPDQIQSTTAFQPGEPVWTKKATSCWAVVCCLCLI